MPAPAPLLAGGRRAWPLPWPSPGPVPARRRSRGAAGVGAGAVDAVGRRALGRRRRCAGGPSGGLRLRRRFGSCRRLVALPRPPASRPVGVADGEPAGQPAARLDRAGAGAGRRRRGRAPAARRRGGGDRRRFGRRRAAAPAAEPASRRRADPAAPAAHVGAASRRRDPAATLGRRAAPAADAASGAGAAVGHARSRSPRSRLRRRSASGRGSGCEQPGQPWLASDGDQAKADRRDHARAGRRSCCASARSRPSPARLVPAASRGRRCPSL